MRYADTSREYPVLAEALGEGADRLVRPGDHAAGGVIHRGDVDAGYQVLGDGVGAQRHRNHGTGRGIMQSPGALRDDLIAISEAEEPGQRGGDALTDAVSGVGAGATP